MTAPSSLATEVLAWYDVNARDLPWRRDVSPWAVLVSEVMLQQTPVARVEPAFVSWIARWPTPAALAADSPGEAVRAWGRLGYPRRALRLHAAAVAIVQRHGGQVPDDLVALLALPGVGTYTARAVAVFAFGQRHPVVDTNVHRVVARVASGVARPGSPATVRDLAQVEELLPPEAATSARISAGLMELGALVCTARSPRCECCPVRGRCAWRAAGSPEPTGPKPRAQAWAGTDRQARGALLAVLRTAPRSVPAAALAAAWPDAVQRARALDGLVADGLAEPVGRDRFRLPA